MAVTIKPLTASDILPLWQLAYGKGNSEWQNWNGPYFHDPVLTLAEFQQKFKSHNWMRQGIWVDQTLVGEVSAYYEDGPLQRWLDVGIVIYQQQSWQHGIGTQALKLWLDLVFAQTDLPHVGLTTWSGNVRMMRVAEKLGLNLEARVPQVRFWQGKYWDSVKYGVLRTDWQHLNNC
ncbi:GNAT family N-acetyltransferase [Lapidilactobacillus wuchangensis]|uniref:GNAT family N-acetyltransferase n=1 Tax=Lapidilactobacillus wuchangensis TaxID=2486001 RepID=UPI001CDD2372|nr:GNAT family protein [Lapidilactobacillus wuchangensis]